MQAKLNEIEQAALQSLEAVKDEGQPGGLASGACGTFVAADDGLC